MFQRIRKILAITILLYFGCAINTSAQTIALWLFDEQIGIYPSCVLSDAGPNDYPMVIGQGGQIVCGKFGNALEPIEQPKIKYPLEDNPKFGLMPMPVPKGRTVEPMTFMNANFCGLMTSGENHLRKEVLFVNPTHTNLNLGDFDWTVEFWYMPTRITHEDGVVFEIGQGPRGENDKITQLFLNSDRKSFSLVNEPSNTKLYIPTNPEILKPTSQDWHHLAFVYSAKENQLYHYVDGKKQSLPEKCHLKALKYEAEAYFTLGRDGLWNRPLPGRIDEIRFSLGQIYQKYFTLPGSFSPDANRALVKLKANLPLLFDRVKSKDDVINLDDRKYLFIDDAIVAEMENVTFNVNPPQVTECVIDGIEGPFRKHVSVIEDKDGLIRMYYGGSDDYLEVRTSGDGIHWKIPDLGRGEFKGRSNIAIPEPTAMGNVFIDPTAPLQERWKYVSGFQDRGVFVYTSPDGWSFKRHKTAILPFRSGSQSNVFYDEQRESFMGYHRSDFGRTPASETQREFVLIEVKDIMKPTIFKPISQQETWEAARTKRLRQPQPWYLDNGPLTPGGFGIEFPTVFSSDDNLDPVGCDIYVPKAIKYPWAADSYLAFPLLYFHYEGDGPISRQILMHPDRKRGSGPIETQLSVSRDGLNWKRFPRPGYIGIGKYGNHDIHQVYTAHGLVKRDNEIWQYFFGETRYHSSWLKNGEYVRAVYRTVQRLDGFVSADSPYEKEGIIITKPLKFKGNRLFLNIDTDATGYAQVGFLDENGKPIKGYTVDDCVYINGDFIETEVEWLQNRKEIPVLGKMDEVEMIVKLQQIQTIKDLSKLEGKIVQVMFRMRGCKLYAMQFLRK